MEIPQLIIFSTTVIALVAIVFGKWDIAHSAIKAMNDIVKVVSNKRK